MKRLYRLLRAFNQMPVSLSPSSAAVSPFLRRVYGSTLNLDLLVRTAVFVVGPIHH